jgi:hypothetical protein
MTLLSRGRLRLWYGGKSLILCLVETKIKVENARKVKDEILLVEIS